MITQKKTCKKNSSIGLLATEGTINTGVYSKFFNKNFNLIYPSNFIQKNSVNKAIKYVKMGRVKAANKIIKPAMIKRINTDIVGSRSIFTCVKPMILQVAD